MNESKQNEIVANGGWVEEKFRHKPRALLCLAVGVLLLVPAIPLCFSSDGALTWIGFALVIQAVLFGIVSVRLFMREPAKETILVSNPDTDLRKLY
jgi:hypothetical protein